MERKIGEIFEYKGEWYQCIPHTGCELCDFNKDDGCEMRGEDMYCSSNGRRDETPVIFKKLEKVGEPITIYGEKFQLLNIKYRWCNGCALRSEGFCEFPEEIDGRKCDCGAGGIYVEIKQNKEDMEEKKLNLKPFDLEAARKGKPVCTRDGRKARIVCFDKVGVYSIIALVREEKMETCHFYSQDGKCADCGSEYDLMMFCEKKRGYVNVYSDMIHYTLEDADNARKNANNSNYIQTLEVEWEEQAE